MTIGQRIVSATGANLGGASAHNRRVIIDTLRLNGALSRAELARATHLTPQTVSNIVAELCETGFVSAGAPVRSGRGQPAVPYGLVANGAFAIGLHIDRHYIRAVATNLLGEPLTREGWVLPGREPEEGIGAVLGLLAKTRADLVALAPEAEDRLVGLGIAMPGPFGIVRDREDPWMMAKWQSYPLLETVAAQMDLPVRILNDATAATVAEKLTGAAHGLTDLVYIFLGYGLGAGIMINGDLYDGAHGNAGELGEMLMRAPGLGGLDVVPTREPTPIEHDASLASLARSIGLADDTELLLEQIETALATGDPRLLGWLDISAKQLRRSVQIIESLFDPQTVILGGLAPPARMEQLAARMMPLLPSVADRPGRTLPRLKLGAAGPFAVAIGAAAEPISRQFEPRFSAIFKTAVAGSGPDS
ncbi:MAG: ROK family transcriptional regulator [Pararhizobium sp.]